MSHGRRGPRMKIETADTARAGWWDQWWKRDFSWEGLAARQLTTWYVRPDGKFTRDAKATPKTRRATLQDVWRSEANRLVEGPDGRSWTVVHAPGLWRDGTKAKTGWTADELQRIEQALVAAIARFSIAELGPPPAPSTGSAGSAGSRIRRIPRGYGFPLDGAVFSEAPANLDRLPFIRGDYVCFLGATDVRLNRCDASLRWPLFEGRAMISGDEDPISTALVSAIAVDGLDVFGSKPVSLDLSDLRAFGRVDLNEIEASQLIRLKGLRCTDEVHVVGVQAPSIDLSESRIGGTLNIEMVKASLDLNNVILEGELLVKMYEGSRLDGVGLQVKDTAWIDGLHAHDTADFSGSTWAKEVGFDDARFGVLVFENADFAGKAWFKDAVFDGLVSFARSRFQNTADFSGVVWSQDLSEQAGAFRETRFESFVDFRRANFRAFSAFDGAQFKSEARFDQDVLEGDDAVQEALAHANNDHQREALEHGFRALRKAAESVGNRRAEQVLFRYELIARGSRTSTRQTEQILSWIYGMVSNYGSSSRAPVFTAFFVWCFFTCVYVSLAKLSGAGVTQDLGFHWGRPHAAWVDAMALSARSMFNLFGIWNLEVPTPEAGAATSVLFERALLHDNPSIALATRVISSIQSAVSGVLLFLIALAVRRRFQIS